MAALIFGFALWSYAETPPEDAMETVTARNGMLIPAEELCHLRVEKLPEEPFEAIVALRDWLQIQEIELLVVPIPPKAAVYAEELGDGTVSGEETMRKLRDFYRRLEQRQVEVLDLFDLLRTPDLRDSVFCRTDTHWSPVGIELAAGAIAAWIQQKIHQTPGSESYEITPPRQLTIAGDLQKATKKSSADKEILLFRQISGKVLDEASPILLLGDSYTLVFHADGDMFAYGGGLPDHLAYALRRPIEVIAGRGAGPTGTRVQLLRRARNSPEWLAAKKVVIWCFAARELTENPVGWLQLPLADKK